MHTSAIDQRPAPLDLSHHFSRTAKARHESRVKEFYRYFAIPGIANLAGGLPNAEFFPYTTLEASLVPPERFKPTPNRPNGPLGGVPRGVSSTLLTEQRATTAHLLVPKSSGTSNRLHEIDLKTALQYGTAQGYPPLYDFLRQITRENMHPNVPYADGPEIVLTCGSTDGFNKAIETFSNEWSAEKQPVHEREGILVEEFCYMNAVQCVQPRGLQVVPVGMDDEGMRASGLGGLRDTLRNWDESRGKRPHLMYTVTIGQNPTSSTLSLPRRTELYELCKEYDVIIIEDEPYWYMQFPSVIGPDIAQRYFPKSPSDITGAKGSSGFDFLDSLMPSYISIDTDGRVVRLDTFSKTISPGCRLGWITAQPALIERILRFTEVATQQPSGFVQSIVAEHLIGPHNLCDGGRGGRKDGKGWAVEGWVRWLAGLRGAYERRMQTMCRVLEDGKYMLTSKGLGSKGYTTTEPWSIIDRLQMYNFVWPRGGMFVWIKIYLGTHPLHGKVEPPKLSQALWVHLTTKPYLVLVAPGTIFSPTPEISKSKGFEYYRLCFAAVEDDEIEAASHRFVKGVNSFWAKKNLDEVEEILGVCSDGYKLMYGGPHFELLTMSS
ncbi:hypothetical protein FGG08_000084 [Glutinoglossum americanum]|uniref:Aminotransferase class I/classII large domain-containing protein n=1 Tax=Glutinoglossum americanum TaxID=1670608 RepID=A0A9P8IIM9_9PEZI|nr:hypothetical protein FGG08_000084 [Glutinoglossum americanum]